MAGEYRIVDLTAPLNERIQCYPTDPHFAKSWHTDFSKDGVYISKLEMGAHSGTRVDAPMHFLGEGFDDVAKLSLQQLIGASIPLQRLKNAGEDLGVEDLAGADILPGD